MFVQEIVKIKALRRKRKVVVYLPDNYKTSKQCYPVLYINDGQNAFFKKDSYLGITWEFEKAVKELKLDIIMVAVYCNQRVGKREDEYCPWALNYLDIKTKGEGDLYGKFLVNQLKPYIDKKYPTDPDDTAIIGSSCGGIISAYLALTYPHIFKKAACLSTPYGLFYQEFNQLIVQGAGQLDKYYQYWGGKESDNELVNDLYQKSNLFYQQMLSQYLGDRLLVQYLPDQIHNESAWQKRVPDILTYFYLSKK